MIKSKNILIIISIVLIYLPIDAQNINRAVCQGQLNILDSLLNQSDNAIDYRDKYGNSPLHFAIYCNQEQALKLLLSHNSKVDDTDNLGRTPLHYSAARNNHQLLNILLDYQADPNISDTFGFSPLQFAVLNENLEMAEKLIDNSANINSKNNRNNSPLDIAIREEYNEMSELLIKKGGDKSKSSDLTLTGPYMGQYPPGMQPKMFSRDFVSTELPQLNAVFYPNGEEFYYSIETSRYAAIMTTKMINDVWTKPEQASFSGQYREVDLFITKDGLQLYYCSFRPVGDEDSIRNNPDIWMVEREGTNWKIPIHLSKNINTEEEEWYPSISNKGTLYFSRGREEEGISNIYFSNLVDGEYQKAIILGDSINSEYYDYDPFIAPDERYLIFASKRSGGLGNSDLFISFKKRDGSWSKAKNMGAIINSSSADFTPILSPDGSYFFFTSWREGSGDIYWIDSEVIDKMK